MDAMQTALLRANPQLSRFNPLSRIIYYDDFDEGLNGWTSLIGNYENDLDNMLPGYRQLTTPMLSNLSFWDNGTHGSFDGTYAMKIATKPDAGAQNVGIKRITYIEPCPIQVEFFFTFKPEASARELLDTDLRSVGILLDLQDDTRRIMPHLRYLNAYEGQRVERWQYKQKTVPFETFSNKTVSHYHLAERDWENLGADPQVLCYNEIPTKVNWQYANVGFDLRTMRYTHFQCNDIRYDMSDIGALEIPAMPNLRGMLNVGFFVESDAARRCSFYLDSVLVSGEWG